VYSCNAWQDLHPGYSNEPLIVVVRTDITKFAMVSE
jgi:hypothetical protein